jgi:prepilin-type N-terminal cleavage/methylation domain-containing protein
MRSASVRNGKLAPTKEPRRPMMADNGRGPDRRFDAACHLSSRAQAFTLIELLVSMAILMIIVAIVSQFFQQAQMSWDSGTRKAEMNLNGRAVVDFMAQEIGQAVNGGEYEGTFKISGSTAEFVILGVPTPTNCTYVKYEDAGSGITRATAEFPTKPGSGDLVAPVGIKLNPFVLTGPPGELPLYVDVSVTVSSTEGPAVTKVYQSRAFMVNRKRYSLQ